MQTNTYICRFSNFTADKYIVCMCW